jgi:hypothetical protein
VSKLQHPLPTGCLKDIQRQLRHDDRKNRDVFRLVAHLDIVRTDLVPMITTYVEDMEVVYNACTGPQLVLDVTERPGSEDSDSTERQNAIFCQNGYTIHSTLVSLGK